MELIKLDSTTPIRSIPDEELNTIVLMEFSVWVAYILSLTDETSAKRLKTALPAIKEHCWSMGFSEIKKMFEMYADNKLSIKPIPNYFDRILFGKIVEAYKQQKPVKKLKQELRKPSDEEILVTMFLNMINHWEDFKENNYVATGGDLVFDRLVKKSIIQTGKKYKNYYAKKMLQSKEILIKEYQFEMQKKITDKNYYKSILQSIRSNESKEIEQKAKCLVLEDYFMKLIKKGIDFKDVLRENWDISIIENSKVNPL